jgi:hypothetical protein
MLVSYPSRYHPIGDLSSAAWHLTIIFRGRGYVTAWIYRHRSWIPTANQPRARRPPDQPGQDRGKLLFGSTGKVICKIRWGKDERHVTSAMKREAIARYEYSGYDAPRCAPDGHGRTCEIDHLTSPELGGADKVDNLWPQPDRAPWNAQMKVRLENRLNKEMCKETIKLKQARANLGGLAGGIQGVLLAAVAVLVVMFRGEWAQVPMGPTADALPVSQAT